MKIVIFCGGYGTRMWPASRKSFPKQFFPLLGGKSFFQNTVSRFEKAFAPEDIFVSTEKKYAHFVEEQAPEIPKENIIKEPERRDNLAAIGLATFILEKKYPGEVMFFSWSDHLISNENKFLDYVKLASEFCLSSGHPVSIDQKPHFPSTHLGWLQVGGKVHLVGGTQVYEIERHVEKPNLQTAKRLFRSGKYVFHTGYGAWRSDVLVGYYEKYNPHAYKYLKTISDRWGSDDFETVLSENYSKIEKISIDFGLFEKIPHNVRYTMPVDFGWKDVGTWQLMYEALSSSEEANLIEGGSEVILKDSQGNLIFGPKGKIIALIGVSNITVVDTPTALLVAPLEKTGKVKEVFSELEEKSPKFVE